MQKASKRLPQWLRDTLMFIFIMGCAVAVCELLSVCYDDNNPFATSVFILGVVLVSLYHRVLARGPGGDRQRGVRELPVYLPVS